MQQLLNELNQMININKQQELKISDQDISRQNKMVTKILVLTIINQTQNNNYPIQHDQLIQENQYSNNNNNSI